MKRILFPAVAALLLLYSCTAKWEDPMEDSIKDQPAPVTIENYQ